MPRGIANGFTPPALTETMRPGRLLMAVKKAVIPAARSAVSLFVFSAATWHVFLPQRGALVIALPSEPSEFKNAT
jgi:hypothetical protein